MKNIILTFTFLVVVIFVNGQSCVPDAQYTAPGIYPDSATNLSDAYVGQSYYENITLITPLDTDIVYSGFPISVTIQDIELTSVTGLPTNFDYACDPPNCIFPGGSTECAELYSTVNPTSADVGLYQIIFETTTTVGGIPVLGTTTQNDVIDYYYLEIVPSAPTGSWDCVSGAAGWSCVDPGTGNGQYSSLAACQMICQPSSVINQFTNNTFKVQDIFPNPVTNYSKIQFISGINDEIVFKVYNLLGEIVDSRNISSKRGVNTININSSDFSDGIYTYSLNNGEQVLTKKMMVVH